MAGGVLLAEGTGESGVRLLIRATARSSLLIFTFAFSASSLRRLWQSDATAWLLRNRRQIGVSFAVSHFIHLAAIVALVRGWPDSFWAETPTLTLVGGGTGYVFIAAMTATSFDRSAAWLGRRSWRRLHLTGSWVIWSIFAFSYAGRVAAGLLGFLPLLLLLLVPPVLRWRARRPANAA
jgi:DMSO/TMAO reductase YedYZ heme-binding membrane subunit